jgi:hypothetical protein
MTPINLWLGYGQKVKIINPYFKNKTGTVHNYQWNTGDYFIVMENGKMLPFKPSEIERVA